MTEKESIKSKPIIFSAPMVRAILSGTKTQTRRIVNPQPKEDGLTFDLTAQGWVDTSGRAYRCPYKVGMRLWVRETVKHYGNEYHNGQAYALIMYKDGRTSKIPVGEVATQNNWSKWTPAIHMPRWAARLTLEVTGVRVERINEIAEEDAILGGLEEFFWDKDAASMPHIKTEIERGQRWWKHVIQKRGRRVSVFDCPIKAYRELWGDIHGPYSWAENPFCWVYNVKRVEVDGGQV